MNCTNYDKAEKKFINITESLTKWQLIWIASWYACWPTNHCHSQSSRLILVVLHYRLQTCSPMVTSVHKLLHDLYAEWLALVSSVEAHCSRTVESRHKHYDPVCKQNTYGICSECSKWQITTGEVKYCHNVLLWLNIKFNSVTFQKSLNQHLRKYFSLAKW